MNSHEVVTHGKALLLLLVALTALANLSFAQQKIYDGNEFSAYRPSAFTPKRGLFYTLYLAPVYTVDPLGLGGKSTYALSLGTRLSIWETKTEELKGLKIKGWYVGAGYEYYPQQFDAIYFSAWLRVKTFIPLAGKIDWMYAFDDISSGLLTRYSIGIEVKRLTLFIGGSTFSLINGKEHPSTRSRYTNAGSISLLIPVYTRG